MILVFCLSVLTSCGKRIIDVEQKDEKGNVTEKYHLDKDSLKIGKYLSYNTAGNLFEESNYKKGKLNGQRTLYHPNGNIEIIENYNNGVYDGPYLTYYTNGNINIEAAYNEGVMEGVLKRYYDTGEIMEEVTFENNLENGPFKEYFKNGKVKWEGNYINGDNEVGIIMEYNEDGVLIKKMDCGKYLGEYICQTIWTLDQGDLALQFEYEK